MGASADGESHYASFARLGEEFRRNALRVDAVEPDYDHRALVRGKFIPAEPVRFRQHEGRQVYDLIGTTWAPLKLVSRRFIDALEAGGFSGWRTYPVEVQGRDGLVEGVYGLAVSGWSGPIRDELSREVTVPPPTPEGQPMPHLKGLYFEASTWDGSDVFMPEGTTFTIARDTVVAALLEAGVTNVIAEPLPEVLRPVLPKRR